MTRGWQLLANVGLGFRAPNVFDLGTLGNRPGNRFNIPNTTLDSERVAQAGCRGAFPFESRAIRFDDIRAAL